MKNALLILHQKRSRPGAIGNKLLSRGFKLDILRPSLGDKLPSSMNNYDFHWKIYIFQRKNNVWHRKFMIFQSKRTPS